METTLAAAWLFPPLRWMISDHCWHSPDTDQWSTVSAEEDGSPSRHTCFSQHLILTKGEGGERETLAKIYETTGITIYYSLLFWTDQYNSKVIIRYPPRPKYCLGKSTHGKESSQSIQYPPTVKYSRSKYCSTQARAEKHDPMIQHVAAAPPFDSRHLSFSHHRDQFIFSTLLPPDSILVDNFWGGSKNRQKSQPLPISNGETLRSIFGLTQRGRGRWVRVTHKLDDD